MKKINFIILILGLVLGLWLFPKQSLASSDLDCGIWICLPGGFPSGCEPYKARFKWRIKTRRSPLVNLSTCSNGESSGSGRLGYCRRNKDGDWSGSDCNNRQGLYLDYDINGVKQPRYWIQ